ncbi:MAG: helix-turn-helix domain-containing protein [Pseudonocardiales bacterium]|nr:helix-turn-helix domain-containing protein [Pseudonocardiales bacterium]
MTAEVTVETVEAGDLAVERATVAALRRSLGAHLAMYRTAAGLAQPELGQALGRTRSMVSKIEHGTRTMPEALWKIADEVCHAEGALVAEYHRLAEAEQDYRAQHQAHQRQVRQRHAQAELDALHASPAPWLRQGDSGDGVCSTMTGVDGQLAEELLRVVTKLIRSMGRRQAIQLVGYVLAAVGLSGLDAEEYTRLVRAVAAPRRVDAKVVNNLAVSLAQCKRLEDTLGPCEVLDSVVAQHGIVRRLLEGGCPDTMVKPLKLVDSTIASAIGGYLIDMGHPKQAMRYFVHARKAGHDAGNPTCAAYAAINTSFAAFMRADTPTALDTAAAARSLAARTNDVKLKALAEQMAAGAYALDGQYGPCMAACDRAQKFLTSANGCGPDSPAYWVHQGTLDSKQTVFLCLLGKPQQAVEAAINAQARYDRTFIGGYTYCQIRLGHALVLSHDITEASRVLGQAAGQAHLSPRLTKELHTARALMQPWEKTHAVTTLDAQLEACGLLPPHQTGGIRQA